MSKLITAVLVFLLSFNFLLTPFKVFAQDNQTEKVDVYAIFWPIVPGTTVADSMFWAKQLKENFSALFIFSDVSRAENQIEISEKRLVEANKLIENKDYSNAKKSSLVMNQSSREEAVNLKRKAKESNQDVNELTLGLVKSLENQQKALDYMVTQFPQDQQDDIKEIIGDLTLQISEAK